MDKALSLLGLMLKAKRIVLGEQEILDHLSQIRYMIIASDISVKQKERFVRKCAYYQIEYTDKFDTEQLSSALGKINVKVIGITDKGFVKSFKEKI